MIDLEDQELTENVFAFGDRRVREVMTPRGEIDSLSTDDDVETAIARAVETGHTRLPLASASAGLDEPVGMIHAKDLLPARADGDSRPLAELARPLDRVSESALISEVLRELRRHHRHLALVADEHGTTTGLVTLEDVLEELVGEIEDEFDLDEAAGVTRDGDDLLVAGSLPLRDLARELGVEIDDPHEATIGGHVVEQLGRVPQPGETLDLDGFRVEVVESDGPLVHSLRLRSLA
jgi:putative hemolysin